MAEPKPDFVQPPSLREEQQELWIDDNTWGKLGSKRGVETVFRTAYVAHVDLTAIADRKANIMISVNGIIMSVLLATVIPRVIDDPWLTLSTTILLITCVITLVFSLIAALPRVTSRKITMEQVRRNAANPLFFGHFVHMTKQQHEDAMVDLLHNRELLYRAMIRDLYGMGGVLQKKYKLLRVAFTVFIIGLVASLLCTMPTLITRFG